MGLRGRSGMRVKMCLAHMRALGMQERIRKEKCGGDIRWAFVPDCRHAHRQGGGVPRFVIQFEHRCAAADEEDVVAGWNFEWKRRMRG